MKTKKVTITLTQDQKNLANKESKEVFGKENISGFYGFLLERWKNNKPKTKDQ